MFIATRAVLGDVYSYYELSPLAVSPDRLPQGKRYFLTACRKKAKARFPLQLSGA